MKATSRASCWSATKVPSGEGGGRSRRAQLHQLVDPVTHRRDAKLRGGIRAWPRQLFGAWPWRAQAHLWMRRILGFPVAITLVALLVAALGMSLGPLWVPFVPGGMISLGFWQVHTALQSLAVVPLGLALLVPVVALSRQLRMRCSGANRQPTQG